MPGAILVRFIRQNVSRAKDDVDREPRCSHLLILLNLFSFSYILTHLRLTSNNSDFSNRFIQIDYNDGIYFTT